MVHIGIDVHQRESQICVMAEDGTLTQQRVATRRDRLAAVLGPLAPGQVVIEASGQSEWVAACVEELGHCVRTARGARLGPTSGDAGRDARGLDAVTIAGDTRGKP